MLRAFLITLFGVAALGALLLVFSPQGEEAAPPTVASESGKAKTQITPATTQSSGICEKCGLPSP
jgi:hypothetical protein